MAWGAPYETPDEEAERRAQQDAALEAQQRAKLSQFERRVVDLLEVIATSLTKISGNFEPIYEYDAQTGRVRVQHGNRDELDRLHLENAMLRAELFGETSGSEGDVGTASAGPASTPGPARPKEDHAGRYSTTNHCGQLHEDEVGGFHECYEAADGHRHRCLCGLTWSD